MKKLISFTFALAVSFCVLADENESGEKFRHAVFFKFKDDATEEQIDEIVKAFGELQNKIPSIIDYEWGPSETVEADLVDGFTHCFFVTFKDKAGLEEYLPHPEHKKFVELLKPKLDKVFVFDYTPH